MKRSEEASVIFVFFPVSESSKSLLILRAKSTLRLSALELINPFPKKPSKEKSPQVFEETNAMFKESP